MLVEFRGPAGSSGQPAAQSAVLLSEIRSWYRLQRQGDSQRGFVARARFAVLADIRAGYVFPDDDDGVLPWREMRRPNGRGGMIASPGRTELGPGAAGRMRRSRSECSRSRWTAGRPSSTDHEACSLRVAEFRFCTAAEPTAPDVLRQPRQPRLEPRCANDVVIVDADHLRTPQVTPRIEHKDSRRRDRARLGSKPSSCLDQYRCVWGGSLNS